MAHRIIATFSARDVDAFGRAAFSHLLAGMLPALNAVAGETVFVADQTAGEDVLILASIRPEPKKPGDAFRAFYARRNPQYGGHYPCPLGTLDTEWQLVLADTMAEYAELRIPT